MRYSLADIIIGFIKTFVLLVALEILTSAVFPAIGISGFKPAFNVLIVLYLAFKIEVPFLPFLILFFQYVHSTFSIEGWAAGTIVGVLMVVLVRYVKDMLNFSSAISTVIVVQIFQFIWFLVMAIILSLKLGDFNNFFFIFFKYIPESIFLSLISHHFFMILDRFWKVNKGSHGVAI